MWPVEAGGGRDGGPYLVDEWETALIASRHKILDFGLEGLTAASFNGRSRMIENTQDTSSEIPT